MTKIYQLPYSQAIQLQNVAIIYSLYLWVVVNRRLPALHADTKVEKGMAVLVESLARQSKEFRKLQFSRDDPDYKDIASRLAEEHTRRREGLRRMLTAALLGFSQRELTVFNRYYFTAQKMNALFDANAHKQVTDEQWAFILGDVTTSRLRRIVNKFNRLIEQHVIALDDSGLFAPRQPVTLDLRAYHTSRRARARGAGP